MTISFEVFVGCCIVVLVATCLVLYVLANRRLNEILNDLFHIDEWD